jgi:hypothetical protein
MQDGFSTTLTIESLDNAELKASIGKSKSISGFESPTASLSHYLRASGTEGVAPQDGYSVLLESIYGAESIQAEVSTSGVSTTTTLKLADTSTFAIGEAVLVKDATNGYNMRVVRDIPNGTDLELNFALPVAPATATALGAPVSYIAQDSGQPTVSVHDYRGDDAAHAAISGARVTSMSVEASAGELINASCELEGIGLYYNPLTVDSTNDKLDFDDGGGEENASITQKSYKTPQDLADEIASKMNALTGDTITVTYATDGKFTIASDGGTLSLLWKTGVNGADNTDLHIGTLIGYSDAADDTGATTYESDSAQDLGSPQTPAFDTPGDPLVAKNNEVLLGDQSDSVCFSTQTLSYELATPKTDELNICAESGKSGSIINERTVSVSMTANIDQHDSRKFDAMVNNEGLSFQFAFGTKTGGNWDAGKSGVLAIKDCTVTAHNLGDSDGLVTVEIEVSGFVDSSGNPETSLNLL